MADVVDEKPSISENKCGEEPNSFLRIVILSTFFFLAAYVTTMLSDFAEIKKNWPKYRCNPQYIATAGLYGFDTKENLDYCMKNVMQGEAAVQLGPIYKILANSVGTQGGLLTSVNSIRLQMATLMGGIMKTFQQFTDRFAQFLFAVRNGAVRMRTMMNRVFATVFSVIYMGMSGVTAAQNFGDTMIGGFLSTFCFPPDTPIYVKGAGHVHIKTVKIGDRLANGSRVTAVFRFHAPGQEMVRLGHVMVSTNHFVKDPDGAWVMAGEHPEAVDAGIWPAHEPLVCLNTDTHTIPLGKYLFSDYDETEAGDKDCAVFIEQSLNGKGARAVNKQLGGYGALMDSRTMLESGMKLQELSLGQKISSGSKVFGVLEKETLEITTLENGIRVHPSTFIWNNGLWRRAIELGHTVKLEQPEIMMGYVVYPHSYITTASGQHIRDYLEVASPDSEAAYAAVMRA
jgi:hypothetical protein